MNNTNNTSAAALAKQLRLERREIKLTLRGLQDDPLLQESFSVLRSIQRRYQPLCRTVCLSSNLTDVSTMTSTSSDATRHKADGGVQRKLTAAQREGIHLQKTQPQKGASSSSATHWNAIEVEGIDRILKTYGLLDGNTEEERGGTLSSSTSVNSSMVAVGGKRCVRDDGADDGTVTLSGGSIVSPYLASSAYVVAKRLHRSAGGGVGASAPHPSQLPSVHDLYRYAYGTYGDSDDDDRATPSSPSYGLFLRHAIQRQISLWGASQLIAIQQQEQQRQTGGGGATCVEGGCGANQVKGQTAPTPTMLHRAAVTDYLAALECVSIIPFFHEATRVASFAIVIVDDAVDDKSASNVKIILIDPTIEIGERHLPQLLDGLLVARRSGERGLRIAVEVCLTHVPRDIQLGVRAAQRCVDDYATAAAATQKDDDKKLGAVEVTINKNTHFHSSGAEYFIGSTVQCPAHRTRIVTVPLPHCRRSHLKENEDDEGAGMCLTLSLVPCAGHSTDSAVIELGLERTAPIKAQNDVDSSHLIAAAFLPPTVGLDGLVRLDYLVEESIAQLKRKKQMVMTMGASDADARVNTPTDGDADDDDAKTSDDDDAKTSDDDAHHQLPLLEDATCLAVRAYHQSLLLIAEEYLGMGVGGTAASSISTTAKPQQTTTGEGLILFACRGGYNCSNGMLEAHWATTVNDLKHQQHVRPLWTAVVGGGEAAKSQQQQSKPPANPVVKPRSEGDGGGGVSSSTPQQQQPNEASLSGRDLLGAVLSRWLGGEEEEGASSNSSSSNTSLPLVSDAFRAFYAYLIKQHHLEDVLHPPMPKLLNSDRNYHLNLDQIGGSLPSLSEASSSASDSLGNSRRQQQQRMLIPIDIRPVPDYLAHPTPNSANVPFLPLFAPPSVMYNSHHGHHHHASSSSVPLHHRPATLPATVQLGAKKPEQWLGSFVSMGSRRRGGLGDNEVVADDGDGLLIIVPDNEMNKVNKNAEKQPLLLTAVAPKHSQTQHSSTEDSGVSPPFFITLRQRFEHMGLMPYPLSSSSSSCHSNSGGEGSKCSDNDDDPFVAAWVIGFTSYSVWLAGQKEKDKGEEGATAPCHHPAPFGTTAYDHRALRLNSCEELAVLNLNITAMQILRDEEDGNNTNGNLLSPSLRLMQRRVVGIAPPKTLVVDIRTHGEFRNGSHQNSIHYVMWEMLEDWRREHTAVDQTKKDDTKGQHAVPRWVERFGTKALDAGITAIMTAPSSSSYPSILEDPSYPAIALYCAGGYRSHITASLLRSVPLGLEASGLLPPRVRGDCPITADEESDNVDAHSHGAVRPRLRSFAIPTYYDVSGGAFQIMTQRPDLWHVKDRSVICVS